MVRNLSFPSLLPLVARAAALALLCAACTKAGGGVSFGISGKAKFGQDSKIVVDRLEVLVPAAAVGDPAGLFVQVQFSKVIPAAGIALGPRYLILPQDVTFLAPVTVVYHYAGLVIPPGVTENQLKLVKVGSTGVTTDLPTTIDTVERTATTTLTQFAAVTLLAPNTSPPLNGTGKVAFLRDDGSGANDLWICDADGTDAVLVTPHTPGEFLSSPRLLKGGSRIAFTESTGGNPLETRVFIVDADGSNRTQVTPDNSIESAGGFDSTGNLLYATHRDAAAALDDLVVYNLAGGAPFGRTKLTDTPGDSEHDPKLAPDGSMLLFLDGNGRLKRMDPVAGAKSHFVTKQAVISYAWRPDSAAVVIERATNLLKGFVIGGGLGEIGPKGTYSFLPKIKGTGGGRNPSYSPNGENLLFEFTDADRGVAMNTIRQIPRKGALASLFFAGVTSVFAGGAPSASD
jgi:hypothetical protein